MTLSVYITSDIEVWPVHDGNWPLTPLRSDELCQREIDAYFWGTCRDGRFGLPYQVEMLRQHGLNGTFFVDPMFSFALGLSVLQDVVACIQSSGHRVELHLHPEWLTDPRCPRLAQFQGPMIADYEGAVQERLLSAARDRLVEAGAAPVKAFRAGGWGAGVETLRALARIGIGSDASLNACYVQSLNDLPGRMTLQRPSRVAGVTEVPMTRFNDRTTRGGRPLSMIGVSFAETRHVLETLHAAAQPSAVMVLHGNEFARTENLWTGRALVPRRLIVRRFERLCRYLADHGDRYQTRFIADHEVEDEVQAPTAALVDSSPMRTAVRTLEQVASRWY